MATFARSLACPDCAYRFSATANNNEKSGLAMQDYTSLASLLANSYYVLSCSSSPLD